MKDVRKNLLALCSLLLLAYPAAAHGGKGYEERSFAEVKAMKLRHLRQMTACIEKASTFEAMKECRPKRRPMGSKPDA